jgi:hypothetical protein
MGGAVKVDRRNFFGVSAGAAIAGPQVVSEVAKKIVEGGGNKFVGGSLGYGLNTLQEAEDCVPVARDGGRWRSVIAECTAELAKVDAIRSRPKHERNWQSVAAQHIDSLRSVSAVNKARMMVEEIEAMHIMAERSWLERRIEDAKKQLGPLGELL